VSNDSREFVGYHGTNSKYVSDIYKHNFKISKNAGEWLGYGAYFFIEGVSCPIKTAREWALNEAYKDLNYKYYSILKVKAVGETIFDLTTIDGLRKFNELRNQIIKKYNTYFYKNRNFYEDDRVILNLMIKWMNIDILISNLYIKTKKQRISKIYSRIPNVTVMLVTEPKKSIELSSIKKIEKGVT